MFQLILTNPIIKRKILKSKSKSIEHIKKGSGNRLPRVECRLNNTMGRRIGGNLKQANNVR